MAFLLVVLGGRLLVLFLFLLALILDGSQWIAFHLDFVQFGSFALLGALDFLRKWLEKAYVVWRFPGQWVCLSFGIECYILLFSLLVLVNFRKRVLGWYG